VVQEWCATGRVGRELQRCTELRPPQAPLNRGTFGEVGVVRPEERAAEGTVRGTRGHTDVSLWTLGSPARGPRHRIPKAVMRELSAPIQFISPVLEVLLVAGATPRRSKGCRQGSQEGEEPAQEQSGEETVLPQVVVEETMGHKRDTLLVRRDVLQSGQLTAGSRVITRDQRCRPLAYTEPSSVSSCSSDLDLRAPARFPGQGSSSSSSSWMEMSLP
jgi:hypothetical protein